MFGKFVFRIVKLAVIGGIVLVAGVFLLSSLTELIVQARLGNWLPFLGLASSASVLVWVSENKKPNWRIGEVLLGIMSGVASISFTVALFLLWIPNILLGFFSSGLGLLYLYIVAKPQSIGNFGKGSSFVMSFSPLSSISHERIIDSYTRSVQVVLLEHAQTFEVIRIMKERTELPISLTVMEDMDLLLIHESKEMAQRILKLLGIENARLASPLLTHIAISLPLIENEYGLQLSGYQMVTDPQSVERLLERPPLRAIISSTKTGLYVIAPEEHALGMPAVRVSGADMFQAVVLKMPIQAQEPLEVFQVAS